MPGCVALRAGAEAASSPPGLNRPDPELRKTDACLTVTCMMSDTMFSIDFKKAQSLISIINQFLFLITVWGFCTTTLSPNLTTTQLE